MITVAKSKWRNTFLVLVGITPIIFLPGAFTPHTWLTVVVLGIALLFGVIGLDRDSRQLALHLIPVSLLVAGVVWLLFSALFSDEVISSLAGRWPRYEGIPLILGYVSTAFLGALILHDNKSPGWPLLSRTVSVAVLATVFFALIETVGLRPLGGDSSERMGSLIGNASEMGMFGVIAFGLLTPRALAHRNRFDILGASGGVVLVLLSGSRGALLGAIPALLALLHQVTVHRRRVKPWRTIAILVGISTAILVSPIGSRLLAGSTVSGRLMLWRVSAAVAADHLGIGVGPNGFIDAMSPYIRASEASHLGTQIAHDSPHNVFLQAVVAGGLPLLVLFLSFAVYSFFRFITIIRRESASWQFGAVLGAAGYGITLMFHFTGPTTTPLAALLLGAVVLPSRENAKLASTNVYTLVRVLAAVGATACLGLGVTGAVASIHVRQAVSALTDGRAWESENYWVEAQRSAPWNCDIRILASYYYAGAITTGMAEAVQPTLYWSQKALACAPKSVDAKTAFGIGLAASGSLEDAEVVFDELISSSPSLLTPRIQRSLVRSAVGDTEGARRDLEYVLTLDPGQTTAQRILDALENDEQVD